MTYAVLNSFHVEALSTSSGAPAVRFFTSEAEAEAFAEELRRLPQFPENRSNRYVAVPGTAFCHAGAGHGLSFPRGAFGILCMGCWGAVLRRVRPRA